jgi:ACR3 family arsenite transporter
MSTTTAPAGDAVPHQINDNANTKEKPTTQASPANSDVEKQDPQTPPCCEASESRFSAFKSMGFLDRFLAIWIFLAMLIGILLGNFVEGVGPALQKGTFVDVSLPIGMSLPRSVLYVIHTC